MAWRYSQTMVTKLSNMWNFSFKSTVDEIIHMILRVIYPNMKFNTYLLLTIKKKILTVRLPSPFHEENRGQHVEALWTRHVVGDSMKLASRFWIIQSTWYHIHYPSGPKLFLLQIQLHGSWWCEVSGSPSFLLVIIRRRMSREVFLCIHNGGRL